MPIKTLKSDWPLTTPDAHVIARNLTKNRKNKNAPTEFDIASAITNVQINLSIKTVSNIVVTLEDPQWRLFLDSGFFDLDKDGNVDQIDLNYPDGTRRWWRLTSIGPHGADHTIDLTFMTRDMVAMLSAKGPYKANRAKMTRAEFLKSLCDKLKTTPINFVSTELHTKEKIA